MIQLNTPENQIIIFVITGTLLDSSRAPNITVSIVLYSHRTVIQCTIAIMHVHEVQSKPVL